MADAQRNSPATTSFGRPPSRLQRRAPASLQINRATDWNVAIPLLSPLITSPEATNRTVELKSREESRQDHSRPRGQGTEEEKPLPPPVFKKWQHPAAPFCYEQAPFVLSFVPV